MKKTCEAAVHAVDGAAVIELTGEVDGGAAAVLNAAYEQAVADGEPGTVVLDFARVDYINSTGIALIVSVLAQARVAAPQGGGQRAVRALPGDLRHHPAVRLHRGLRRPGRGGEPAGQAAA